MIIGKWGTTHFTLVLMKKLALTFPKNKGLVRALAQLWINFETTLNQFWDYFFLDNFEKALGFPLSTHVVIKI